jgi:hypothetical protein
MVAGALFNALIGNGFDLGGPQAGDPPGVP